MNTLTHTFLLSGLAFLLTACGGVKIQGIDVGRIISAGSKVMDIDDKTEAEEIEIGEEIALTLMSQAPLADDPVVQAYVNRVGYWLVQHSDRQHLPWHFVVINNPSANAFAAPGGYIFITTGMLQHVHNEAELAGVLAHEIAHVVERHHLNALIKKSRSGLLGDLLVLANDANKDSEDRNSSSTQITGHYDKMVMDIYERGLDRDDEHSADKLGAVITARAGYDHYGFASVLQTVGGSQVKSDSMTSFLKRHPDTDDRLDLLETTLAYLDQNSNSSRVLASRYRLHSRVVEANVDKTTK